MEIPYFVVPADYLKKTKDHTDEYRVKLMDGIACPKFSDAVSKIAAQTDLSYLEARKTIIKLYTEWPRDKNSLDHMFGISGVCNYLFNRPSLTKHLFMDFFKPVSI